MFGHTSVRFLLLSIMLLGMVAMVWCSCGTLGEECEGETACRCSNHECCNMEPTPRKDQCMTQHACYIVHSGKRRRRVIQKQKRFLGMPRGHAR
uniref:Conotoxin n=1 Tax=Conus andremenezi TaxID=1077466 RepID=A0A291C1R3_9COND|nr:conotoxin [Conus andremenezi]